MKLHHLALGARDVERVADFYQTVLGLKEDRRHLAADGRVRSIWLDLGRAWLMIEKTEALSEPIEGVGPGPFLIAVEANAEERAAFESTMNSRGASDGERTEYTSYGRDPEGNRVAVSCFPRGPNRAGSD